MDYLTLIARTVFFYIFIIIIFRLMGKKEISQLSIQDLVVSILIAELVAISIENFSDSILYSILPILSLLILQVVVGYITMKSNKIRNLIDGKPVVIINNGKLNYSNMKAQRYTLDDLLFELRNNGINNINKVKFAILERSGDLNIFEYENDNIFPLPLVLDGDINDDALEFISKDRKWLFNYLKKKNIFLKDIFYGFYKDNKIIVILRKDLI